MSRGKRQAMTTGKKAAIVFSTVVATALVAILVINLAMGDKEIDKQVKSLYTVDDPQFVRTMGSMLGPFLRTRRMAARDSCTSALPIVIFAL